ncbi:MAG TPA: 6-phosphogluconolactonase [Longimicrobium sp.]|jgi:6-phosphogluconolactonase|uniref:6-phosphogluconolactonase n=1 Tax=Longimicrobium sp. TaxID=2029185 RepID=UPI002ED7C7D4
MTIHVHPDPDAASRAGAERFRDLACAAVESSGRFAVALSGGTAPERMYRMLGEGPFLSAIPWEGVHVFWGDDRCVPPGHPRSNFTMADRAFLRTVPIPPANVHRMRGELPPEEGAAHYTAELESVFGPGVPRFDLVHLGIGPDGHTASLFPFDELLRERERTVGTALFRELGEWRLSFTLPVINAARVIDVLALGAAKAEIVRTAIEGPLDPHRIPMQFIHPTDGQMIWTLDEAAAARLKSIRQG